MKVLTGIITYNPKLQRLKENIDAVVPQTDALLIIDNGSFNFSEIKGMTENIPNTKLILNGENKGVAAALRQIMDYAADKGFDWVLTLDQDSVCMENLVTNYRNHAEISNVAMMSCYIKDRNIDSIIQTEDNDFDDVTLCITSGSFVNVLRYRQLPGFDEKMFVDSVDFDFCAQILEAGMRIIRIHYVGLLHEVGHGRVVKLFGKTYETYDHSPFRQYYMARNRFYLAWKHPTQFSRIRTFFSEFRIIAVILIYEKNRKRKIAARLKGIRDFKKMQVHQK